MIKTPLDQRLKEFTKKYRKPDADLELAAEDERNKTSASRVAYEFIGAILFFSLIGYLLDGQFHTLPNLTLLLFFTGFAVGIYNVWRAMNGAGDAVGLNPKNKQPPLP